MDRVVGEPHSVREANSTLARRTWRKRVVNLPSRPYTIPFGRMKPYVWCPSTSDVMNTACSRRNLVSSSTVHCQSGKERINSVNQPCTGASRYSSDTDERFRLSFSGNMANAALSASTIAKLVNQFPGVQTERRSASSRYEGVPIFARPAESHQLRKGLQVPDDFLKGPPVSHCLNFWLIVLESSSCTVD